MPRSALPLAPHCTMPTPWPQPRPSMTIEPPSCRRVIHFDGTTCGRLPFPTVAGVGYRFGSRHTASWLRRLRKESSVSDCDSPLLERVTLSPSRLTDSMGPAPHVPERRRVSARSPSGIRTVHDDVGDSLSSFSMTGLRYGSGAPPKTSALEYVCPLDVEE